MSDAWDGRPQHPERDGDCVIITPDGEQERVMWSSLRDRYEWPGTEDWLMAENAAKYGWKLQSKEMVYTAAEVAAREAAAAAAMRDAAADWCADNPHTEHVSTIGGEVAVVYQTNTNEDLARGIRNLPLPGADALAAALREAEKRGIERAAEACSALAQDLRQHDAPRFAYGKCVAALRALLEDRPAQEDTR